VCVCGQLSSGWLGCPPDQLLALGHQKTGMVAGRFQSSDRAKASVLRFYRPSCQTRNTLPPDAVVEAVEDCALCVRATYLISMRSHHLIKLMALSLISLLAPTAWFLAGVNDLLALGSW